MKKGFSLIELLVIICLIAIISLVATKSILKVVKEFDKEKIENIDTTNINTTTNSVDINILKTNAINYINMINNYITMAELGMDSNYDVNKLPKNYQTECKITNDNDSTDFINTINNNIRGQKPNNVILIFKDGKITNGTTIIYEKNTFIYDGENINLENS